MAPARNGFASIAILALLALPGPVNICIVNFQGPG